jgi:hypothetical protein
MIRRLARKPLTWVAVAVLVAGGGFSLYWFTPWKVFTDSTVNEALPTIKTTTTTATATAPTNVLLTEGQLISHEHETAGTARLVRLAEGRVQLLLENLVTSDGPDLHVWLTDQPVTSGVAGWRVFDDSRYVELGELKANRGDQVYDVPSGTSLNGLTSVTIWCKRFAISFGAAALAPA